MTFHPIKGYNSYCGPATLATLLGITTDEAAARIRKISPARYMVKGTHTHEMLKVLKDAGWQAIKIPPFAKRCQALADASSHYTDGMYLCVLTTHFLVLSKKMSCWVYVDNHQKTPAHLYTQKFYKTKRIKDLYYLVPPPEGFVPTPDRSEEGPESLKELFRLPRRTK